jgi:hypothetical protein
LWAPRPTYTVFNDPGTGYSYITWRPNTGRGQAFLMHAANPGRSFGYVPANGDKFMIDPLGQGAIPFSKFPPGYFPSTWRLNTPYWIINLTPVSGGWTFDVSASPPGRDQPILPITDSTNNPYKRLACFFTAANPPMLNAPTDFMNNIWQTACWANALGLGSFGPISTRNTLLWDIHNRRRNAPGGPYLPYAKGAGTGGQYGYERVDARYCTQPTFA